LLLSDPQQGPASTPVGTRVGFEELVITMVDADLADVAKKEGQTQRSFARPPDKLRTTRMTNGTGGELKTVPYKRPRAIADLSFASPLAVTWFVALADASRAQSRPHPALSSSLKAWWHWPAGALVIDLCCPAVIPGKRRPLSGGSGRSRPHSGRSYQSLLRPDSGNCQLPIADSAIVHVPWRFSRTCEFALLSPAATQTDLPESLSLALQLLVLSLA